ncbi:unnamed protein product [Nezara viridula]|uniref:Odorant receptor n=1 Tax=Nezara viridula TaxID=85310 RepID=A0A9P0HG41_NEZVI|nr:unnamed protein product [Nezara viridula]
MGYQDPLRDSDVIDGLNIRFLKFFGMWKALNDYKTTGKKSIVIKMHILVSLIISIPYLVFQVKSFFTIQYDIQKITFVNMYPMPALQMCSRMVLFWFHMDRFYRLSDLHFAIYCSEWYTADAKFRKAAQMLMIRSRRSSTLTAISMYPINLETLSAIVQFTYSAAALMSGMVN